MTPYTDCVRPPQNLAVTAEAAACAPNDSTTPLRALANIHQYTLLVMAKMTSMSVTTRVPSRSDHFGVSFSRSCVATRLPMNAKIVARLGPSMNSVSGGLPMPLIRSGIMALSTVVRPVPVVRMSAHPVADAAARALVISFIPFPFPIVS